MDICYVLEFFLKNIGILCNFYFKIFRIYVCVRLYYFNNRIRIIIIEINGD